MTSGFSALGFDPAQGQGPQRAMVVGRGKAGDGKTKWQYSGHGFRPIREFFLLHVFFSECLPTSSWNRARKGGVRIVALEMTHGHDPRITAGRPLERAGRSTVERDADTHGYT